MIDYDFSTLNDKEFENLTIELISKEKDKRYERFKAGKDGGIDGRFYHTNGNQEIIQCKHYLKTGFDGLISSLKRKSPKGVNEIIKVKNLNPSKYIFVTSLPLSADNKKTIKTLFIPYIKNDNDIYGQEDLNVILSDFPNIEEKHYKLWISSTTVLNRIMNNAIKSRSEALVEDIKEKSKYYVITDNHNKAIEILNKTQVIIIAGEPGIGKTTLAKNMAILYIEKGFECYDIENTINEAEAVFEKDKKQIFYFDDFLGSNYLEAFENKKDSHIIKFIEIVKRYKNKRFILTSRTNIFNQSLLLSDTFKSKNIDEDEFIISIKSLKEMDKAYILYNHIWHSHLEEKYIDEIYKDKRYKDIINHKNFSPRIIEFITDTIKIKKEEIQSTHYWTYLIEKLDNPQDIWKNTFDKQSNEFVRIIVILTVFNGNKIKEGQLKDAYNKYIGLAKLSSHSHTSKEFDSIIKEVIKYFLNRSQIYDKIIEYSLFNPSIADYILNRYKNDEEKLILIYLSLNPNESLYKLRNLAKNKIIDNNIYRTILNHLFSKEKFYNHFIFLKIALDNIDLINDKKDFNSKIKIFVDKHIEHDFQMFFSDFLEMIVYLTETTDYQLNLKKILLNNTFYNFYDLSNILKIYKKLKLNNIEILKNLENKFEDELIDILETRLDLIEIEEVHKQYIKNTGIQSFLNDTLNDILNDIDNSLINFNRKYIIDSVDSEDFSRDINEVQKNKSVEQYKINKDIHDIDDLFER